MIQTPYGLYLQGPQGDGVECSSGQEMESKRSGVCNIQGIPKFSKGKSWNLYGMRPDKERDSVWDDAAYISQSEEFSCLLLLLRASHRTADPPNAFSKPPASKHLSHTKTSCIHSQKLMASLEPSGHHSKT